MFDAWMSLVGFVRQSLVVLFFLMGLVGHAQAQSSVSLYGLLDIGFNHQVIQAGSDTSTFTNPSQSDAAFGLASGQQSGSRWGIRSIEDLGGGVKLTAVFESAVTVNTGQSSDFTRQSTLGVVDNRWGSLDLGRRVSPGTEAFAGVDPFDFSFGQSSLTSSMGATFIRFSNLMAYTSPNLGGFNVYAGWSFDTGLRSLQAPETAQTFGTSSKFRALSVGTRYAVDQLLVAVMYDAYYSPAGAQSAAVQLWSAGATYDLRVAKWHVAYGQSIGGRANGVGILGNVQTDGGDTNTGGAILYEPGSRTNQWMLGVTVPTGASSKVFASVQQERPGGHFDTSKRVTQTTAAVGFTHALSVRTDVYAFYSYKQAPELFKDAQSHDMGIGIRHAF